MKRALTKILAIPLVCCALDVSFADQHQKIVFITSGTYASNMGGLEGADERCQAEADDPDAIVPAGTYLAWLSDGTESPTTRFSKSQQPYVLPDGTKISENFSDLTDGSILHPMNIDSKGQRLGKQPFWSSTKTDGTTLETFLTCESWTWERDPSNPTHTSHSMIGDTLDKSSLWTLYRREMCGLPHRLACFQQ